MNRRLQVVGRKHRQIIGREEALQQHDGFDHGAGAQHQRLFDTGHRIGIRIHQGAGDRQQSVAIGVGLDHSDDLASRGVALDHSEVVAQGRSIDLGSSRFHGFPLRGHKWSPPHRAEDRHSLIVVEGRTGIIVEPGKQALTGCLAVNGKRVRAVVAILTTGLP